MAWALIGVEDRDGSGDGSLTGISVAWRIMTRGVEGLSRCDAHEPSRG